MHPVRMNAEEAHRSAVNWMGRERARYRASGCYFVLVALRSVNKNPVRFTPARSNEERQVAIPLFHDYLRAVTSDISPSQILGVEQTDKVTDPETGGLAFPRAGGSALCTAQEGQYEFRSQIPGRWRPCIDADDDRNARLRNRP